MHVLSSNMPQQNRTLTSTNQQGERNLNSQRSNDKPSENASAKSALNNVQVSVSGTARARAESKVQESQGKDDVSNAPKTLVNGAEDNKALPAQLSFREQGAKAAAQIKVTARAAQKEKSTTQISLSNEAEVVASPKEFESLADRGEAAAKALASSGADAQQSKLAEKASVAYAKTPQ